MKRGSLGRKIEGNYSKKKLLKMTARATRASQRPNERKSVGFVEKKEVCRRKGIETTERGEADEQIFFLRIFSKRGHS